MDRFVFEELEKKKLQRMHDCIKREGHLENNAILVRDIAICIRLIDIFMEDVLSITSGSTNLSLGS